MGRLAEHLACARHGAGGRDGVLSVGSERELRLARHRADRPDHRAPGQHRAERAAGRRRQEPRLRRHEPVRHKQVLRLRPHRDRHARQRRPAVHVPGQLRRLLRASSRARASSSPAPTPTRIPASTPTATRCSRPYSGLQTDRVRLRARRLPAARSPLVQLISQIALQRRHSFGSAARGRGRAADARSLHGIDRLLLPHHPIRPTASTARSRTSSVRSASRSPTAGASRPALRYDIDADELASDMVQVRYADECFVLTASYTDNLYHNPTIVDGQTLMVRFELKHLGHVRLLDQRARACVQRADSRAAAKINGVVSVAAAPRARRL